jgi:hypothetical protein
MYRDNIAPDPGSLPRGYGGSSAGAGVFTFWPAPLEASRQKRVVTPGDIFSLRYMSHRTGYPHVNSSLTEESVMDNIAWLVPGLANGQRRRDSTISVASPLFCHLVASRAAMAGRMTAHR